MSESALGSPPANHSSDNGIVLGARALELPRRRVTDKVGTDADAVTRFVEEQLAREYADIERASAVLRLGEPALQSLNTAQTPVVSKARPLWLLIGLLWLSTALLTAGAVAAIATLAG
jgi:hypothetical protein